MLAGKKNHVSLTQVVSSHAKQNPDRIALEMGSQRLTYSELDRQAGQLANYLRSVGAGPEVAVGLCIERSPQFVVAALAIIKSGAAYLPMEVTHPAERLRFIIKDAGVNLLITQSDCASVFTGLDIKVIVPENEKATIERQSPESPNDQLSSGLAYVIYTSGSTGHPKGVELTHHNLANLIRWHTNAFAVDPSTRGTFQAGVGFDAAVWEIWPLLAAGGSLFLPDDSTRSSPGSLRDWLIDNEITISFVPTVMAEELISLPWPSDTALRFLLTGADVLYRYPPPDLPFSLVNNYGPTECTVVTTSGVISANDASFALPPIGCPIDGVKVYILDNQLRAVPDGTPGEIYVGGNGVGRGYRNQPDLTAQSFITYHNGERLYRTGDLGRRLPNGEIGFLGRIDDQVKIRGYRIELNEIKSRLSEHPFVQTSVVIMREDRPGDKRLVAYVVVKAGWNQNEEELREFIRQRLPDYMEPVAFVWMESLPITANGKIDRAALPAPEVPGREFVSPRNQLEEALAKIIRDVLKVQEVGIHDDFFHLGAHSLLGAQIVARVRNTFGAELKLLDVFDAPTIAGLAKKIELTLARQLAGMTDTEVETALATLNRVTAKGTAKH